MAPDDRAPVVEEELDDDIMGTSGRQSRAAWHAGKMRDGPERQSARKQRPRRSRARGAIDAPESDPESRVAWGRDGGRAASRDGGGLAAARRRTRPMVRWRTFSGRTHGQRRSEAEDEDRN